MRYQSFSVKSEVTPKIQNQGIFKNRKVNKILKFKKVKSSNKEQNY